MLYRLRLLRAAVADAGSVVGGAPAASAAVRLRMPLQPSEQTLTAAAAAGGGVQQQARWLCC
jgi:hypothetical protein